MQSSSSSPMAARQLTLLRHLLATLRQGNDFYREKIRQGRLENGVKDLAHFCQNMPFTTKAELVADQKLHPPYGSNLTYPLKRYTRFHQTSGSTGSPMRWLDTPASWDSLIDSWCDVFHAAGVDDQDRCFFAFSFGPFLGFWTAFEAASRIGSLCIPGGGMRTVGRLKAIFDNQATVLCCTPTYAIHLGQEAKSQGLDTSQAALKKILVAGEPGGSVPAVRQTIRNLWPGATVYDHHGMTEVGPASLPCPVHENVLHMIEPGFLTEVIDPQTQQPVAPGEPGELVLSNLRRDGMPLLRYRTGDLVKTKQGTCACGRRQTQLLGGILGRIDDMVIIRGVNLYPAALDAVVRQIPAITEYQVLIEENEGLNQLRIEIETAESSQNAVKELVQKLHATFNLRIQVEPVASQSLPRFELKAKRWRRIRNEN